MIKENIRNVSKGTIIRTILLFVALINQILIMFGFEPLPIEDAQIESIINSLYEVISTIFLIITTLIAWWKNNSITKEAIEADDYLKELRQRNKIVNKY